MAGHGTPGLPERKSAAGIAVTPAPVPAAAASGAERAPAPAVARPCSRRPGCRGGAHRGGSGSEPEPRTPPRQAAGSPALPPLPRNYAPPGGAAGGGVGRARIREAPFGAAPLDTATRPQPSAADRAARPGTGGAGAAAALVPGGRRAAPRPARQAQAGGGRGSAAAAAARAQASATTRQHPRLLPFAAPHPAASR